MRRKLLSAAFCALLWLLICEVFFSTLENSRIDKTKKINGITASEEWFITGNLFTPLVERSCYQGPLENLRQLLEPHAELGYRLRPNLRSLPSRLRRGGATVYDVAYSTTETGWRMSEPKGNSEGLALFLGDSYTFGLGLEESATLPSRFAAHGGAFPVNLGVPGWGPQQVLRAIELGLELKYVKTIGYKVTATYFLLTKDMLARLAGIRIESEGTPFYKFGEGPPRFSGKYPKIGGQLWHRVCSFSAFCEAALAYFRIAEKEQYSIPPEASRQLAAVLSRLEDLLRDRYGYHRFRVISWNNGDLVMDQLEGDIRERGVEVISLKSFLPGFPAQGYTIPGEGYPTAKATDEIAEFLATEK